LGASGIDLTELLQAGHFFILAPDKSEAHQKQEPQIKK
jgi:hypothetical protein